jgi:hypothetical protein
MVGGVGEGGAHLARPSSGAMFVTGEKGGTGVVSPVAS